jgi:DNA polymerase sigma
VQSAIQNNYLEFNDPKAPFFLCLEDPADPFNDLGRKAFAWKHIQATFEHMATQLQRELAKPAGDIPPYTSLLAPLIGPYLSMSAEQRNMCQKYGRSQLETKNREAESLQDEINEIRSRLEQGS